MPALRLDIAYDGTAFAGWALQPRKRTVQGVLEEALATVLRRPVSLTVAGRTDAGVHALAQVASLALDDRPPPDLARRLNGLLPDDVAILAAAEAPEDFDARRDAVTRRYRYRLLARRAPDPFERGRALHWPHPIDRAALDACAAGLTGTHDFTAFTPTQTEHSRFQRRVLAACWSQQGEVLSFEIEADAFLRHMVRALVGTMLEVAGGRREAKDFLHLLEGARREDAGDTAAPHGLYLVGVGYQDRLPR